LTSTVHRQAAMPNIQYIREWVEFKAPPDTTDVSSANLVRELVNCTTAQTVSPYTPECVYTYVRSLFMSIVHSLSDTDSL